ncbi:MAG: GGDEF domain-containing protein [Thermodesulfobacteriota bacterium]
MNLPTVLLLFGGGIVLGLFLPVLVRSVNFQLVKDTVAVIGRWSGSLGHLFTKKNRVSDQELGEFPFSLVDPREQQINDSAQAIRAILLSLAALFQRTGQAASNSSFTLGDVRSNIENMRLPKDLSEVHERLIREIDRIIVSNTTLKEELASSQESIEMQRQQIESLKTAVRIDGLTQLANRAYFDEKLAEMLRLRKRYQEPFSLLMIDVDNFKPINDTLGHPAGDRILKGIAFKLKATVRESDFIARYGGDEFSIILTKAQIKEAREVAWKICFSLRESRFLLDGREFLVTLSIGLTEVTDLDTIETIIERSDKALYQAKQEGRNQAVSVFAAGAQESEKSAKP